MWPLLVGTAFAGLHADLTAAAIRGADVSFACTSGVEAARRAGRLIEAMGSDLPPLPPWWTSIAAGALAEGALGSGMVRASMWLDSAAIEVGLDSEIGPAEFARRLAAARNGSATPDGATWLVSASEGEALRVSGGVGTLTVASLEVGEGAMTDPGPAVIEALPEGAGCALLAQLPLPGLGPLMLGVHLPFTARTPTSFVVGSPAFPDLAGIEPQPGAPRPMHTRVVPDGVVVLGLGLDGVDFSTFLDGSALRDARRLQHWLPLLAGSTAGLFQREPEPAIGLVLPMGEGPSAAALARRIRRLVKEAGAPAVPIDRTHLLFPADEVTVYVATTRGRVLVATDPGLLGEMEADRGELWVGGRAAEMAERFPVVTFASVLPDGDSTLRLPEPATLGITLEGGLVRGELFLPLTIEELAALAARAAAARRERGNAPAEEGPSPGADGV